VDVVAYILCYCLELKDKPSTYFFVPLIRIPPDPSLQPMLESHSICRALSYMVQAISAEPGFGAQLSVAPIRVTLPSKWNIIGTSADFFLSVSAVSNCP
jgi:hypothetical protein